MEGGERLPTIGDSGGFFVPRTGGVGVRSGACFRVSARAILPAPIPVDDKNLQITIANKYGGRACLKVLLKLLKPVIDRSDDVTFLWAACRAVNLRAVGGKASGVNIMQPSGGGPEEEELLQG